MSDKRSWLEGPEIPAENAAHDHPSAFPGEHLGLPRRGSGSVATVLRRVGGLTIDWIIGLGVCSVLFPVFGHSPEELEQLGLDPFAAWGTFASTWNFIVFLLLGTLSVAVFGRTPGQALLGMGVARIDDPGRPVGIIRAFARTALTMLLFPPVVQDADARGLHDRLTGTAVIRG